MLRLLEPCISPAHIVTSNYLNVRELCEYGYEKILWVKELLASYLSHCMASSLKVPLLLSKPCQTTLCLMGKAFKSPSPQPRWRTVSRDSPLALLNHRCCSTKQTACATFSSMAAMVVSEQHLWLNISGISPFGLSGSAVNMVVQNSWRRYRHIPGAWGVRNRLYFCVFASQKKPTTSCWVTESLLVSHSLIWRRCVSFQMQGG